MPSTLLNRLSATVYAAWHMRGQGRYPFKPLASITADGDLRASRMVAYAYRYVPYYRETMDRLGLSPADFRSASDLTKLPLLEREHVQRDPECFVSTAEPLDNHLRLRTSGSTGRPCTFYHHHRAMLQNRAYAARARAAVAPLLDSRVGYRQTQIVALAGAYRRTQEFLQQYALLPPGVRLHRQVLSVSDPPEANVRLMNEFRPDVLISFGSYLAMLFAHLRATGMLFHRPRAIVYSADSLPKPVRHVIEEEYNIPVFGTYGAVEAPVIGFECEQHTGLHLNMDLYPIRIVDPDGNALPHGARGEVVVSNLINRASVLLNYRLGDLATLLPHPCTCGRSLPLLSELYGRTYDFVELPSGGLMRGARVGRGFKDIEGLWQWQVIQESATHFVVGLSVAETSDRLHIRQLVAARFGEMFGPLVTVDVQFDHIQRTVGGKVSPVISKCPPERVWQSMEQEDSCS